jgi:AraC-like DNA-binding protein/predicted transcriptional regulator YdeE
VNYLGQIQRGIDFVEAHLEDDIDCAAVARHARVSRWHFQRMFKALTNETLHDYIRGRRLSNALDALEQSQRPILDIALAAGYESQAAFTRAFKAAFELTPARYRALGKRTEFVRKLRIDDAYLSHIHSKVSLEPEWVELQNLTLTGLRTSFFGIDSDKSNIGEKLPPLWDAFLTRSQEIANAVTDPYYGIVISAPGDERLDYIAGLATNGPSRRPDGMVSVTVREATYARFTHRGLPQELNRTISYIYASWLPASGMRHTYGPDLEFYGADYIPDSPESIICYAIPVRRAQ